MTEREYASARSVLMRRDPVLGEAIKRIHLNQSVSAVLKGAQAGKR